VWFEGVSPMPHELVLLDQRHAVRQVIAAWPTARSRFPEDALAPGFARWHHPLDDKMHDLEEVL